MKVIVDEDAWVESEEGKVWLSEEGNWDWSTEKGKISNSNDSEFCSKWTLGNASEYVHASGQQNRERGVTIFFYDRFFKYSP